MCVRVGRPVGQVAAEDHLCLANQQVGETEGLLVVLWTRKVFSIQFLQAHQEVTKASQEELAAVDPVVVTLALTCDRLIHI